MGDAKIPPHSDSRWRFGLREFFFAVTLVATYFGALVASSRELEDAAFWRVALASLLGLVGGAGGLLIMTSLKRRAGAPIAKLPRDRLGIGWLIGAVVPPVLAMLLLAAWQPESNSDRMGVVFFVAIAGSATLWALVCRSLSIRESGLVVDSLVFTPWCRIARFGWTLDENGKLHFGQGLSELTANVPPSIRIPLEEFLVGKLGPSCTDQTAASADSANDESR